MNPKNFGRYQINAELGRGGFGTVYRAYDPRFKRDVALKVLPREFLHNPNFKARFEREAQTIAALEHPAIVPVYDFGEEEGQPFLVMRFLPGGTLTERLGYGAMALAEVIRVVSRIAPALAEAHERGIIHRDLKPDNILFDQRHDPYVTDFGLVKLTQEGGSLTAENVIVGTPAYMSPEQARGESEVDGRSDIYALGIILFEMLTGQLPYDAKTPVGLVMKHITEPVPHILEINPDLPAGCENVISTALAKEPDERFATAIELVSALQTATGQQARPTSGLPDQSSQPYALPASQKVEAPSGSPVTPKLGGQAKTLRCPNCGATLPAVTRPDQPVECGSCGSRFIMTPPEIDKVITCPQCQTTNAAELRFCSGCDTRLYIDCVRCHTSNRIDSLHCAHCGTNLQSAETQRQELLENRRRMQEERDRILKEKKARQLKEKLARLTADLATPAKQEFAIYQLSQIGGPAVSALINTLLKDSQRTARCGAAKTLGQICGAHQLKPLAKARGVKGLIKGLEDPEPAVRYYAAEALGNVSGPQAQLAVEPLGDLLRDSDDHVRKQARAALEKIGGPRAQEILNKSSGFMGWLKGN